MKKLKLTLNKETIASLSSKELGGIRGGNYTENVECDTGGCNTQMGGPCDTNYTNNCDTRDYSGGGQGCEDEDGGTYTCTRMTSHTCGFCVEHSF